MSRFKDIEEARRWCIKFIDWYNHQHLHSGLKFITPAQRHSGNDIVIMENRKAVYSEAYQRHPERWSRKTRNWDLPESVTLNPDRKGIVTMDNKNSELMQAA